MTYLAATHNQKKRAELLRILSPLGIEIVTADEAGVDFSDVEETGTTFLENALLKARAGCQESGMPCIADDSGLAVDALDGAPGVYSARYAGEHGNDVKNNTKLLQALRNVPDGQRTARFVSVVALVYPDGRELTSEGTCEGIIARSPAGEGGFGYDPIFLPLEQEGETRSMAQLSPQEKDAISHRGKALQALAGKINKDGTHT